MGGSGGDGRGREGCCGVQKILKIDPALSTDGEAANTGCSAGLWKKLTDELGRFVLYIWCVCHRSDLAFHDVTESVSEMKRWYSQIKSTVSFFTVSSVCRKSVQMEYKRTGIVFLEFKNPPDVRFAEHIHAIYASLLNNLPVCVTYWKSITGGPDDKKIKAQAAGYLKQWQKDGQQYRLRALMADILHHLACMQKEFQKTDLLICDVQEITLSGTYLRNVGHAISRPVGNNDMNVLIASGSHSDSTQQARSDRATVATAPGLQFQRVLFPDYEAEESDQTAPKRRRTCGNKYVALSERSFDAIRTELSCYSNYKLRWRKS